MMTIEYGAFDNCLSLKAIEFQSINEPVFTNINRHNNLPKDFKIVVPDDVYGKQVEIESPYAKKHVMSATDYKLLQIAQKTQNIGIYEALVELKAIQNISIIDKIVKLLEDKYAIDNSIFEQVKAILQKKNSAV